MIYEFSVIQCKNRKKIEKRFYLTADNDNQFYRNIRDMYRLLPTDVTIVNKIVDDTININNKKVAIEKENTTQPDNEITEAVGVLLNSKIYGRDEQFFRDKEKEGYVIVDINLDRNTLTNLLNEYKRVKIHYLRTGKKKDKIYKACCK